MADIKKDFFVPYRIKGLEYLEQEVDFDNQEDLKKLNLQEKGLQTISKKFKDIEKHIVQKAINIKAKQGNSLFQFEKLKKELEIKSIEELQTNKLADFDVKIIANQYTKYDDIDNSDKLGLVIKFLDNIFAELKEKIAPKIGSDFIAGDFKKFFAEPKTKTINENNLDDKISTDNHWYVLDGFVGTIEEKGLIKFIQETIGNLEQNHEEIYLLRNEEVYKIYDFEQGRGFQPDFILFLKSKEMTKQKIGVSKMNIKLYYQIFIEPKGDIFTGDDGAFKTGKEAWKGRFLEKITQKYGFENVITAENLHYRLIGLPFFNENSKSNFEDRYRMLYTQNT